MVERKSPVRVQHVLRCTYCREWKDIDEFTREGDHVIPASMGGEWIDHSVCGRCNTIANDAADALIGQDFLVRFLRSFYEIPDRNGKIASPPMVAVPAGGGVIKVALRKDGPVFTAGLPSSAFEELALDDPNDVDRLREIVDKALGPCRSPAEHESRDLARRGQPLKTPQPAWSRFMAKLGLACGREAYGDDWLDSRQAEILSADLLSDRAPRFSQRWHYPPVEEAWPYEPPKHRLWIEPYEGTAMLKIALFGQILGAVPVNDVPAHAYPSAWSLDPHGAEGAPRTHRGTSHSLYFASAALRVLQKGGNAVLIADPDHPLLYIRDGPDGPIDLGVELAHVNSPEEAIALARSRPPVSRQSS